MSYLLLSLPLWLQQQLPVCACVYMCIWVCTGVKHTISVSFLFSHFPSILSPLILIHFGFHGRLSCFSWFLYSVSFFCTLVIWPVIMSSAASTVENSSFIISICKRNSPPKEKLNLSVFNVCLWTWRASCPENYLLEVLGSCCLGAAYQPVGGLLTLACVSGLTFASCSSSKWKQTPQASASRVFRFYVAVKSPGGKGRVIYTAFSLKFNTF